MKETELSPCMPQLNAGRLEHSKDFAALWTLFAMTWSASGSCFANQEPLSMHGHVLIAVFVLFLLIFFITISTMIRHRQEAITEGNGFRGTTGVLQWLWATVPFAILFCIDYVLITIHYNR